MIKGVAHVCLSSTNLDETLRYYLEGLGLERRFDFVLKDGSLKGFYLAAGGRTFIEVFKRDSVTPSDAAPIRHLCLEVDDIDAAIKRLRDAGFKCDEKKLGADHSWQAWTSDPDGVAIEFHQYTPESCQATGESCRL